jgi:virginiamycin B lyase
MEDLMRLPSLSLLAGTAIVLVASSPAVRAENAMLSGAVTSAQEGAMEGVLVSVKKDGSTITTTVVTDDKGHFAFPAGRLEPGHYTVAIRAAGYTLDEPKAIDVTAQTTAAIKLGKTQNIVNQLSSAEWMLSMPGEDRQKAPLINCTSCHTLQRIVTSSHDAAEFEQIFHRMGTYAPGTTPTRPQLLLPGPRGERPPIPESQLKPTAAYLASVDLSTVETRPWPLKTLPRPKGASTKVIITEYDLPRKETEPHDVVVAPDGKVWYSDFANQFVGELDPATGRATDVAIPVLKPEQPKGSLDLELDPSGNLWVAMMYQAGIARIDRVTREVKAYGIPKEWQSNSTQASMVSPMYSNVDGKVWTNNQEKHDSYRLDIKTGQFENVGQTHDAEGRQINGYGMPADQHNNLYLLDFPGRSIGYLDTKTGKATVWSTPLPNTRPRRGHVDAHNRLWFAEFGGNGIAMFDPATQKIREWQMPTKWSAPYDAVPAKNGEVWTGSMLTDQVARLDPETDQITEYLLPHTTNIRRVFVEETGSRPVLWVGNNHGASIVRVEPLD